MRPWIIGIGTFVLVTILGSYVAGPTRCRSGWQSPSIGLRGACSHHGGVDRFSGGLVFFLAIVSGVATAIIFREKGSAAELLSNYRAKPTTSLPSAADMNEFLVRLETLDRNFKSGTDVFIKALIDESLSIAFREKKRNPFSHLNDLESCIRSRSECLRPETTEIALDHLDFRREWVLANIK